MSAPRSTDKEQQEEYGLIVHQAGEQQQRIVKFLSLVLNYLYGLNVVLARNVSESSVLLMEHGRRIRCVFVVQNMEVTIAAAAGLSLRGSLPLVLLLPGELIASQRQRCAELENIFCFPWEQVSRQKPPTLRNQIDTIFESNGIGGLFDKAQHVSFRVLQQRVEKRLTKLHTLPTLPKVVLRIIDTLNDPESTTEQLEQVLRSDPAIVHKLIQLVNTVVFAGPGHKGEWTLREAIVRLGRKKLGSIALQIKLINSLVKPEDSKFDLRRFWIHSVGSALLADRIYSEHLVELEDRVEAHEYWVAALLHDLGKLVLGFFFWGYYERVVDKMNASRVSFRQAEASLGDIVTHEQVGQLILMRASMEESLVQAVARHHEPDTLPDSLICLVHLSDNLCKDMGLGYTSQERGVYSDSVLRALNLDSERLEKLRDSLAVSVVPEITELVDRCMGE